MRMSESHLLRARLASCVVAAPSRSLLPRIPFPVLAVFVRSCVKMDSRAFPYLPNCFFCLRTHHGHANRDVARPERRAGLRRQCAVQVSFAQEQREWSFVSVFFNRFLFSFFIVCSVFLQSSARKLFLLFFCVSSWTSRPSSMKEESRACCGCSCFSKDDVRSD